MPKQTISFEVPGQPKGKGRPKFARIGSGVKAYTPEKTASYENLIKLAAGPKMAGRPLLEGALRAQIVAFHKMPKMSRKKQEMAEAGAIRPTTTPDWDNIGKIVCDALNGVVYVDDKQIVEASVSKRYSSKPGVLVVISTLD